MLSIESESIKYHLTKLYQCKIEIVSNVRRGLNVCLSKVGDPLHHCNISHSLVDEIGPSPT
jgi:hypothetical protein